MATHFERRILQDYKKVQGSHNEGIMATLIDNRLVSWKAVIYGPEDTIWEGGTFQLTITFPKTYPNSPPDIRFLTRMFHPNVYTDGNICLDILQKKWSPIYDVIGVLTSTRSLLSDPNPHSPANPQAAKLFLESKSKYEQSVIQCVE